jgi:hypothetical protein
MRKSGFLGVDFEEERIVYEGRRSPAYCPAALSLLNLMK